MSEGDGSEPREQRVLADAAKTTGLVFNPSVHCGGHKRRCDTCTTLRKAVTWKDCPHAHDTRRCRIPEHRCRQHRGQRTDHPRSGNCWMHGGRTATGKQHAATEAAAAALASLGIPQQVDPQQALLEQVWEAAGNVAFLRSRVSKFGEDLTLHVEDTFSKRGENEIRVTTIREDVKAVVKLYNDERDRLARVSKLAIDAGIAERRLELTKQTVAMVADVILAVFDELGLEPDQRERGRIIAGQRFQVLAGGLAA